MSFPLYPHRVPLLKMAMVPSGPLLALRFDNILGKKPSGDFALLLYALANACAAVADEERFSLSRLTVNLDSTITR